MEKNHISAPVMLPIKRPLMDFAQLGTRHDLAIDFIGQGEGAVAFVASADGPIRAFVKFTPDKIWYWPDCRESKFSK